MRILPKLLLRLVKINVQARSAYRKRIIMKILPKLLLLLVISVFAMYMCTVGSFHHETFCKQEPKNKCPKELNHQQNIHHY
jgi:hypothetical protein